MPTYDRLTTSLLLRFHFIFEYFLFLGSLEFILSMDVLLLSWPTNYNGYSLATLTSGWTLQPSG